MCKFYDRFHVSLLSVLGAGYAILLIYASLMPFDFSFESSWSGQYRLFWSYWPFNPGARISGSDVLSNLVLYTPLGWMITVRLRLSNFNSFFSLIASSIICFLISFSIEMLQIFTISRVASGSDWLLNTISGTAGSCLGLVAGKKVWISGINWLKNSWQRKPVVIAALILAGLMAADALSPFMPTILLTQVGRNFKRSLFSLDLGFAAHPWHWWVIKVGLVYGCLTLLFSSCLENKFRFLRLAQAFFVVSLFCLSLEVGKLFIVSRFFNAANVISGWLGCIGGLGIGLLSGKRKNIEKLNWGIALILLYIFYLAWFPFDFNWRIELIPARLPSVLKLLPLYDYAMGATLNHARLFVQSIFLTAILVYLLKIRFGWFKQAGYGMWTAAFFCAVLGILQEGGQLFLASRYPSATDIYCFAAGGCLGAVVRLCPKNVEMRV
ncbi:VanZ family protein [Desulfobacter curvatus]|uniref:VanZ family protein n=1 Tax=Desulfobacter curvatus TaxID=2290 RepID=UPI0003A81B22|nr:VanZ family protein [Desulfobacter curvatus]